MHQWRIKPGCPGMPATISASVTNGGISADGLSIETTESSRRRLEGRLNGGGPQVRLEGTNGGIRIATPSGPIDQLAFRSLELLAVRRFNSLSTAASSRQSIHGSRDVAGALGDGLEHRAIQVGVEHRRVDVALPAHRLGVSQAPGHHLDSSEDVPFGLGIRGERLEFAEQLRRQNRARPRPEILRCQILPGDVLQVGIDLVRADGLPLVVLIDVLKEPTPAGPGIASRYLRGDGGSGRSRARRRSSREMRTAPAPLTSTCPSRIVVNP